MTMRIDIDDNVVLVTITAPYSIKDFDNLRQRTDEAAKTIQSPPIYRIINLEHSNIRVNEFVDVLKAEQNSRAQAADYQIHPLIVVQHGNLASYFKRAAKDGGFDEVPIFTSLDDVYDHISSHRLT